MIYFEAFWLKLQGSRVSDNVQCILLHVRRDLSALHSSETECAIDVDMLVFTEVIAVCNSLRNHQRPLRDIEHWTCP
jgi:hypothetical protein